jgi:hypothetical protein
VGGSLYYSNSQCAGVALKFTPTALEGAYIIDVEPQEDERGFFARSWCANELRAQGLISNLAQCSVSFNKKRGTLRGMHYQGVPHEETKIVRCTAGSIYDVIIDMRLESVTEGILLSADIYAVAKGECIRCLDPIEIEVERKIQELYRYEPTADKGGKRGKKSAKDEEVDLESDEELFLDGSYGSGNTN